MNGIKLINIHYRYHKHKIFSDVNLEISPFTITCLIGLNGSGKSTLLKLMAGLIPPCQGKITLDGIDIQTYPRKALAKKLAFLPQQCRVIPSLTVREYVALGRFCHRTWLGNLTAIDYKAIDEAICLTDLVTLAEETVAQLSFGQQQRVRIAMMLAQQTQYLLLDEPMTGLDLKQQYCMLKLFSDLQMNHAKTIIIILHDLNQVMKIGNEVILIKDGHVVGQGSPNKVLNAECLAELFDKIDVHSLTPDNLLSFKKIIQEPQMNLTL